jgi:hypothetical protein
VARQNDRKLLKFLNKGNFGYNSTEASNIFHSIMKASVKPSIQVILLDIKDEIKILEQLKNYNDNYFKTIHIDGIDYYAIVAKIRDYEKSGFATNINGKYDITEKGVEYLNELLK